MCGRFALFSSEDEIVSHFHLRHGFSMRARYNIAPTQMIPAITTWQAGMAFLRWGFISPWGKREYINARAETVAEKATFKQAFFSKRCLIPASGYYEWRIMGHKKQPYFVSFAKIPLFAFGGIWSIGQDEFGQTHESCAILTQEAPETLRILHPRAPLAIRPECYQEWLEPTRLLRSPLDFAYLSQSEEVIIKPVSRQMSHPSFEGPECILAL